MTIHSDSWQRMQTENEQVMLVNSADEVIGVLGKFEAHRGTGQLHRAITVFLFDSQGRTLLTKRSARKPLWPLWWDAASSTHQWPDEPDVECALRRLPFEIGVSDVELRFAFKYEYHAVYSPEWAENEVNHILVGRFDGKPTLNPDEAIEYAWKSLPEIREELSHHDHTYAPWFPRALEKIDPFVPGV